MKEGEHILLEMDSTVAVSFINKMGGTRSAPLRDKAIEIWNLVLEKKGLLLLLGLRQGEHGKTTFVIKSSISIKII